MNWACWKRILAGMVKFRTVPWDEGYRVGSDGSVWSRVKQIPRGGARGTRSIIGGEWRELRRAPSGPYYSVRIRGRNHLVHRLILMAFVGKPNPGEECRHLNGDGTDNRIENLRWGTRKENHRDSYQHGTRIMGEDHPRAKLTSEDVRAIREAEGTLHEIARRFHVSHTQVWRIRKGKSRVSAPLERPTW